MQQGGPIDPVQNIQGVLDFSNYEKVYRVITLMSIRFQQETNRKNKAERRAFLEADDNPQYRKACQKHMKDSQEMRNSVSIEALKMFGTSPKVYNQASTYYRRN